MSDPAGLGPAPNAGSILAPTLPACEQETITALLAADESVFVPAAAHVSAHASTLDPRPSSSAAADRLQVGTTCKTLHLVPWH